jgi:hypothetical protein
MVCEGYDQAGGYKLGQSQSVIGGESVADAVR